MRIMTWTRQFGPSHSVFADKADNRLCKLSCVLLGLCQLKLTFAWISTHADGYGVWQHEAILRHRPVDISLNPHMGCHTPAYIRKHEVSHEEAAFAHCLPQALPARSRPGSCSRSWNYARFSHRPIHDARHGIGSDEPSEDFGVPGSIGHQS